MPRVTISVSEEQEAFIEEKSGDDGDYESKSAFMRECLNRYERVDELEARVSDLRNQLQAVNRRESDIDELTGYIEGERELQQMERERRNSPLWKRVYWLIYGRD